jgi:uncharacterized protein (DUF885 family)
MNIIDTRDLYKRKCELEELRDAVTTAKEEFEEADKAADEAQDDEDLDNARFEAKSALDAAKEEFGEDEAAELAELEELESEISDFMHGETMIEESDFEDYARQLAEDLGAIPDDAKWPCNCIDWAQAASELRVDYTSVTYQGTEYLVRA